MITEKYAFIAFDENGKIMDIVRAEEYKRKDGSMYQFYRDWLDEKETRGEVVFFGEAKKVFSFISKFVK